MFHRWTHTSIQSGVGVVWPFFIYVVKINMTWYEIELIENNVNNKEHKKRTTKARGPLNTHVFRYRSESTAKPVLKTHSIK